MSEQGSRDYQGLAAGAAAGAGALAVVAAFATRRAPRWVRVTVILGLLIVACGASVVAYRYSSQPTTLTVAAGSLDGDAPRMMAAIAGKLASAGAPVRLKVVEAATASEAASMFAAGKTDLAVVRGDAGDLSSARAVVIVAHSVVLLIAPPGSTVKSMDDLKGKTVGVIGASINQQIVSLLTREYDLERSRTRFRDLLPMEVSQVIQKKEVQALLVVVPISEKYVARLRELVPRNPKMTVSLVPIESAGAIASVNKAYESYELPKGTLRGSPPVPDEDLTTLRLPLYLVASKKVSDDAAGALAKSILEARRDLMTEFPLLAQIAEPDKDKDAFIPLHPGAAAYFEGEQKSFFDKYGDQIFYGSMLLGTLTSLLAGAWRFMIRDSGEPQERPLSRLSALMDRVRAARDEAELAQAEQEMDDIIRSQLEKYEPGEIDAGEAAAVSLAAHRLEHLLNQRRAALRDGAVAVASGRGLAAS